MAITTTPTIGALLSGNAMAIGRALTPELGGLAMAYGRASTKSQRAHIILEVAKKLQHSHTATETVKKLTNRDVKTAVSMVDARFAMDPIDSTILSKELLEEIAVKQAAPIVEKAVERSFLAEILEFAALALARVAAMGSMGVGVILVVVIVIVIVANGFFHWW